jgi:geranylgeranyl reductase family protein
VEAHNGRFDAIVVGGGPAGSTAARELAASGARVLVVDRATFPRYKACGGGIPLRTARLLPFPLDSVIEEEVSRIEVTHRGHHRFVRDAGAPFAHMVMRDRFDALLLDEAKRAGAQFRPATLVRTAEVTPAGVAIRAEDGFTAEASYLVCADGAHSPVGKMAGLGAGIAECAAWEVEVEAGRRAADYHGRALIELDARPWAYAWLFPKAELLSIGIVVPPGQGNTMKRRVDVFVRNLGLEGAPVRLARGHKLRFRRGHEPIASDRALLAGDAAGLADEFTEEGISYAVTSGRVAARGVLRALGGGDLRTYQAEIDREVMPELRAARLISYMFFGMLRRAAAPWMFASGHTGFLWDAFFAVQRGDSTYAREVERMPLLPWAASRLLERRHG